MGRALALNAVTPVRVIGHGRGSKASLNRTPGDGEWPCPGRSGRRWLLAGRRWHGDHNSVEFVLGLFAAGWTSAQVLENYPTLSTDALRSVFAYSAEVLHDEALYTSRFDAA